MYSGLGGHGSVVFSYLQDRVLAVAQHHLIFFGIEDVVSDYEIICRERSVEYSFLQKPLKGGLAVAFKLYKTLSKENPDVILNHSLPTVPIIIFYRMFRTTKTILIEHTPFDRHRFSDTIYFLLSLLFFDKIVLLTKTEYSLAEKKFGRFFNSLKIEILPNGIDVKKFSPGKKPRNAETIISTHCRITDQKDLPTLLKGFALFLDRNQGVYRLKIAGDGVFLNDLKKLSESLGISEYVEFTGFLNEEEIIKLLRNTDIYINTSKQEAMSTSIMQAMSCGLPCIVSNIASNLELVDDKKNGLVFKLSAHIDLADKIQLITDDPLLAAELSSAARKTAELRFSNRQMIDRYVKLIAG